MSVLNMLKVEIPTLIVRLWQPDEAYYPVLAGAGVVGHAWPVYHRFRGGRGESPILGGLLVIDASGLLVTTGMGWLLGWMTGNLLVLRWGFFRLMISWFWLRTHDLPPVVYMVFVNIVYWIAMLPEIRQCFEFKGQDQAPDPGRTVAFLGHGGTSWPGFRPAQCTGPTQTQAAMIMWYMAIVERDVLPDQLIRWAIRWQVLRYLASARRIGTPPPVA